MYKPIEDNELANNFKHAAGEKDLATKFWQSLTSFAVDLIINQKYSQAQRYLLGLLHKCQKIDPNLFSTIHKGNPYYFLGIASYLMNDMETATFFMDSSVSEDLRYGSDAIHNPSPSTYFLALEGDKSFQFAKQLTEDAENKVKRAIDLYNSMQDRPPGIPYLTINTLREKFLYPALSSKTPPGWRTLATAFISFFIGWDFRNEFFDIRPGKGTSEPFYIHLFKGCVLFESFLKENTKNKTTGKKLDQVLGDLYKDLGLSVKPNISGNLTLKKILNKIPTVDNRLETAICFTGRTRNTLGHKLSWDEHINQFEYQRLFEMISTSCLHVIACLY